MTLSFLGRHRRFLERRLRRANPSSATSPSPCVNLPLRKTFARAASDGGPATTTVAAAAPPVALIFDTETTGKVDFTKPGTDRCQPDLVQLGMILVDTATWTARMKASILVELGGASGKKIEPGAFETHGISEDDRARFGLPLSVAAECFRAACLKADVLVAHNLSFDDRVMDAALHRGLTKGVESNNHALVNQPSLRRICTMQSCTDVLKLPGRFGKSYKWPSLAEAYGHFSGGKALEGGHDALVDAEACLAVFRGLVESKAISLEPVEQRAEERNDSVEETLVAAATVAAAPGKQSVVKPAASSTSIQPSSSMPTAMGKTAKAGDLNINVTEEGFYVGGGTYPYKEDLKSFGGVWDPLRKKWKFNDHALLRSLTRFVGVPGEDGKA